MPRAIEFVKWAHSKGLSSRSTGECGQDDKGKCGPGKTCAKGDGSGGQSALPAGRAHASKCGRKYAPGKEEVVEQDRKLSDDQWNRLPVQSIPHRTVLQANEETLKTKPINDLHVRNAAAIAKRIGVPDTHAEDRIKVLNSADSLAQLVADAKATAPAFMQMARDAAKSAGGNSEALFGEHDQHVTKKAPSLAKKIGKKTRGAFEKLKKAGVDPAAMKLPTAPQILRTIDDSVRGTIVTDTPEQLGDAIRRFRSSVEASGGRVEVDNKWNNNDNPTGYVGVHKKVLMKTPSGRDILSELQFHLRSVYDGTDASPKDTSHGISKQIEAMPSEVAPGTAAIQLIFATAAPGIAHGS